MEEKKEFGLFIKEKRQQKGYSQKDLAEKVFVSESAVSKWERGISYPDITLINLLCEALDITEHELVTASTDNETRKLKQKAKKFDVIKNVYFLVPTISYIAAILICFICNICVNGTLSWFFIVLSSIICAFSFVPGFYIFSENNKFECFIFTSAASICLLLLTCGIYTKTAFWVPTAIIGTLMGYTAFFMPISLKKNNSYPFLKKYRFLITAGFLLLFTCVLLLAVFGMVNFNIKSGILLTFYCFAPLVITTAVCLLKFNGFLKAGISVSVFGFFSIFVEKIIIKLFGGRYANNYKVDFSDWANCVNGNVRLIIALSFAAVALTFLVIGIINLRKNT